MADYRFSIGADIFVVGIIDPRTQLLMMKRLMRFVPALTASDKVLERLKAGEAVQPEDILDTVSALAPLVADMPDADLDFVCDACMSATRHVVEGKAFPVRDPQSGVVSNRHNEAPMRKLTIVGNVLRIVFAPMMAQIAPSIAGSGDGVEATA